MMETQLDIIRIHVIFEPRSWTIVYDSESIEYKTYLKLLKKLND